MSAAADQRLSFDISRASVGAKVDVVGPDAEGRPSVGR
jgi:hypothetical protein